MIITDIKEYDKKRFDISIDGEHAFRLYKGEVRHYKLQAGDEITSETVAEIVDKVLGKRAVLRAMNLLQKKDYTEYKLREKLNEGGYPQECIDSAIDYVKSYHYIDDCRFAENYISYYMELRSRARIRQDLIMKGIDQDIVEETLEELYSDTDGREELNQILRLLQKKHYDPHLDFKERQKIMAFLYRKGYSQEAIRKGMDEYEEEQ